MSSLDMQTERHISSQHMAKAYLVHRRYGQTESIMAIAHCHQNLLSGLWLVPLVMACFLSHTVY